MWGTGTSATAATWALTRGAAWPRAAAGNPSSAEVVLTLDIYCKPESPVASCSVYLTCYRGRHPSHSQSSPLCDKSDCAAGDVSVHGVAAAVARLHLARFPGTINFRTFVIISNIYIYLQCYLLVVRTPRHALVLLPRRWRRGRGLRLLQLGGGRAGLHRPVL